MDLSVLRSRVLSASIVFWLYLLQGETRFVIISRDSCFCSRSSLVARGRAHGLDVDVIMDSERARDGYDVAAGYSWEE